MIAEDRPDEAGQAEYLNLHDHISKPSLHLLLGVSHQLISFRIIDL